MGRHHSRQMAEFRAEVLEQATQRGYLVREVARRLGAGALCSGQSGDGAPANSAGDLEKDVPAAWARARKQGKESRQMAELTGNFSLKRLSRSNHLQISWDRMLCRGSLEKQGRFMVPSRPAGRTSRALGE